MATNSTETELKYDAPAGIPLPRLDRLPQVASASAEADEELEAHYYDTSDLRLMRAGITLRRRRGGHDAGWHLKLPAGPDSRCEIRLPLGRAGRRVPAELAGLVRARTRGAELRPVAEISTRRQRVLLLDDSGSSLAELAADDVRAHTMGEATAASQWQEVEIELTGGDRSLLAAADRALRSGGLRPARRTAKLERALGLDSARQPDSCPRLKASSPSREVVLAYLRTQAEALKALDPHVRRDQPDSVHQMRVAARRVRSTLQSFGAVIPRAATRGLVTELRWLGGVLGDARDGEVLAAHLQAALGQFPQEQVIGPVQARTQGHFAPQRAAARAALLEALDSPRYFALLDDLDQLIADPPASAAAARSARAVLPREVSRAYRRTARRMRAAGRAREGAATDRALHKARKAAKRARYAGEAVTPALGSRAGRFTRQMKKVQSVLGDHHDTVIARQAERELGISAHLGGENAYSYGLLHGHDACDARQLRARARKAWRKAARPRYRRWLG
jgi:CHAD domain-containing protein